MTTQMITYEHLKRLAIDITVITWQNVTLNSSIIYLPQVLILN